MLDVILNVEDNDASRALKTALLEADGFMVMEARLGSDAIDLAELYRPSLVLLDTQLPDIDGFEVCRRLKDSRRTKLIPILQVSAAFTRPEDWARGLEVGSDSYLMEPIDGRVLLAVIRTLIRRAKADAATKQAKERADLRRLESERRYRSVFENAPGGICRCGTDGTILSANSSLAAILVESDPGVLAGKNLKSVFNQPDAGRDLIRRWRNQKLVLGVETEWVRSNGEVAQVVISVNQVSEQSGNTWLVFVDDVTSRRLLEEEFRHAQKMEAVGRLAGGIAHDFNNLLTAILGYCDLMDEDIAAGQPSRNDLRQIREAARMAASLTAQLLAFSRRQMLHVQPMHIGEVVTSLEPMLRRLIGEQVDLVVTCAPGVTAIDADAAQLQQVVMNLVVNARDAMPDGGRLVVETSSASEETLPLGVRGLRENPGAYAVLTVADTGTGIPDSVRPHLFEPIFTTKEKGHGTGLGLATVYGIVKQLGGEIDVDPGPGRGATFRVFLPASSQQNVTQPSVVAKSIKDTKGSETVLLVEDEIGVRTLAKRVLQSGGYQVLEADSPRTALQRAEAYHGTIDLVITDVIMPGMSVREMVARLRARGPIGSVLYMSGYAPNCIVHEGIVDDDVQLLHKPFSPTDLLYRVREVLDAPAV